MSLPNGSEGKELPEMQETQEAHIWSLGQEDPLEDGMATQSSILAWRIPWTEEPTGLQFKGSQRHNWSDLEYSYIIYLNHFATQKKLTQLQINYTSI